MHREFEEIVRFWFDRGVAGFRIDVAHGLYKDAKLRDNPPAAAPPRSATGPAWSRSTARTSRRPTACSAAWRAIAETLPAARLLLGETWVGDYGLLAGFYGNDDELQLAFNFPFVFAPFAAAELSTIVGDTLARLPAGACPVWTASNHDVGRFPSRWCDGDARKARLALLVLATLPGTVVLYYGDEIAMTDVDVPPELRRDAMSRGTAPRDRARTPMPWDASPTGGFTADGVRPWLPFGDTAARDVARQRDDPDSVLSFCRAALALRRGEQRGEIAGYELRSCADGLWVYQVGGLVVAANFTDAPAACPPGPARSCCTAGPRIRPAATSWAPGKELSLSRRPWRRPVSPGPRAGRWPRRRRGSTRPRPRASTPCR